MAAIINVQTSTFGSVYRIARPGIDDEAVKAELASLRSRARAIEQRIEGLERAYGKDPAPAQEALF